MGSLADILRTVRGAVAASTTLHPLLTHFAFTAGRVCAFNGHLSIDAPCDDCAHLQCTVPADQFMAAIDACTSPPAITHTEGAVHVRTKLFHARIPAGDIAAFPKRGEGATRLRAARFMIDTLLLLRPFVGDDASRPWASGVMFCDATAAATNNTAVAVVALPRKIDSPFILPSCAIDELLRLDLTPLSYALTATTVTFFFDKDIVLQSQLIDGIWPREPAAIVAEFFKDATFKPLSPALLLAVERVRPFVADARAPVIVFDRTRVRTEEGECRGAVDGVPDVGTCKFRAEPLIDMLRAATHADFTKFPRVPFKNDETKLRGVLVGMM